MRARSLGADHTGYLLRSLEDDRQFKRGKVRRDGAGAGIGTDIPAGMIRDDDSLEEVTENFERLRERLAAIELDLDAGRYRAGRWQALIHELRACPDDYRVSLANDVSRVSQKLYLRSPRKTISIAAATGLELAATLIGCVLLLASLWTESNILAISAQGLP